MDEDIKINEKVELDFTGEQSKEKKVEFDSAVEKSNGKKVELDFTVEQSNEKKVELDSTVEQSNEKEVELDSTIQQSNEKKVELDSADKNSNKRKLELDSTVQQSNKKRKPKEVAIFGNYRNYYGYRIDQGMEEDPRIKVLKKEWFEGKDCLDIGCNSGLITITIAKKFCCRSIRGIDIDSVRIEDAYWNLRRIVKTSTKKPPNAPKLKGSNGVNGIENCATESTSEETMEINGDDPSSSTTILFDKVSFKKENFVLNKYPTKDKCYDTIICLSVTKWIQLNWGDEGLITLFSKIWRLLRPGGILILEPQPWNSYSNNRQVSEIAKQNYHDIQFYPRSFQEILLDKIGFRTVEDLTHSLSGSKSGFKRPILAFWK